MALEFRNRALLPDISAGAPARICAGAVLRSRCGYESHLNQWRISEELRIVILCARPVPLATREDREASGAGKPNGWLVAPT